jgi:hypothetical protein
MKIIFNKWGNYKSVARKMSREQAQNKVRNMGFGICSATKATI